MGSYTQCWIGKLFIDSSKNDIDIELISLFRADDKIVRSTPITDLPVHLIDYQESVNEDPSLKIIYYETSVEVVRDRLNVLGYDLATAEESFRAWISGERNRLLKYVKDNENNKSEYTAQLVNKYKEEIELLSSLTPKAWMEGLRIILESDLKRDYYRKYDGFNKNTIIGYMLSNEWYGFPGYDLFVPLRLATEVLDNNEKLIYDITPIVWSDYFNYDDDFIQRSVDLSASEFNTLSKIIVLTEGKTDAWILSESFDFLYPHLKDYFSFLDFENTRFSGGVGNLANIVKAFAGSGIVNNVIALFDNDTASTSALMGLHNISMPSNIMIRRLPELDLLNNYPTIGPTGLVKSNVNGIAGSIELYLGEDILRIDKFNLVPVQWTGYDKLTNKYQGEVLDKVFLQNRFKDKLIRARKGEDLDWQGLRSIFEVIFSAFSDKNRRLICKRASDYYF